MNPNSISQVASILKNGGIIAYPTEAIYGLGCDPFNEQAVQRLLEIKHRPIEKGLIIIAASWQQVQDLVLPIPPERLKAVQATWPGPYTWIFPANKNVPAWVRGSHPDIAIRVSAHPIVNSICLAFGPIISTSANITGQEPAYIPAQVKEIFADKIDFIVEGNVGNLIKPTQMGYAVSGKIIR